MAAADRLRSDANELFRRGRYGAAADLYTEAIALNPKDARLYSNRALANKMLAEGGRSELWERVAADAEDAIRLNGARAKARYLKGVALCELGRFDDGLRSLEAALEDFRVSADGSTTVGNVRQCQHAFWRYRRSHAAAADADSTGAPERAAAAASDRDGMPDARDLRIAEAVADAIADNDRLRTSLEEAAGLTREDSKRACALLRDLSRASARPRTAARAGADDELPEWATCPISFEIMIDPVLAPSGHSYERAEIERYLRDVRQEDPISRSSLEARQLVPNFGLRKAINQWMRDHPFVNIE